MYKKPDSMGGVSHFNQFEEKYKRTMKSRRKASKSNSLKDAKVDAPGAVSGISKVIR